MNWSVTVSSVQSYDRLEKEKDELNAAFDGVLQKLQEQHRSDLVDLEQRLKTFYSAEWEKVHQTYQEEADKCKAQMEQRVKSCISTSVSANKNWSHFNSILLTVSVLYRVHETSAWWTACAGPQF